MKISEKTAENLIEEISSVIDYDINIMDESGAIIASTDPGRKGQFHEGAYRIIQNHLNELLVYYDDEYSGCKKGINMPIMFDGEIVGVIGITGEVPKIIKYGNLIQKVSQILINDLFNLQRETLKEQNKLRFVSNWITGDFDDKETMIKHLEKHGLSPFASFIVAIVGYDHDRFSWSSIKTKLPEDILVVDMGEYNVLISNKTQKALAKCITSQFDSRTQTDDFLFAISSSVDSYEDVPRAFDEAIHTYKLSSPDKNGIILYDDELLNIILDNVDEHHKKRFVAKIFAGCTKKDVIEFSNLIRKYYDHNGSINAIARDLFVHKNTVQYKINKILNMTGLDMRKCDHLMKLYVASIWYDEKFLD